MNPIVVPLSKPPKDKIMSEANKAHLRKARKGIPKTEEHKRVLREALRGAVKRFPKTSGIKERDLK